MAASMEDDVDLVESDDYYAWLGLSKNATPEQINDAYRKFSRMYHPDKHAARTDPKMVEKAQELFTRIKKAHEVLSDAHTRAIYDTMGLRGLETEGWQVISRTKTPQEILEEYDRLEKEREERRMQQRTNPRGTVTVGVDATDVFDRYQAMDAIEYTSAFPQVEISHMSISQSVECPLTPKDTAVLSGMLSSRNGVGSGNMGVTMRRVMSHTGWAEMGLTVGNGTGLSLRGFRTLGRRSFGTMSGSLQLAPHGLLKPSLTTVIATQLDKNLQGRLVWNWGGPSSMSCMLVWDRNSHHVEAVLQLGLPSTYVTLLYTHRFSNYDTKVKTALRAGTFGVLWEYGCEKKITQFSTLGASVTIGVPTGVLLKVKLNRGNQTYIFPIHLSESIVPNAIFYGTVVPVGVFFAVKVLIVNPFLKGQKERELLEKKSAYEERMTEKKHNAQMAVELMEETVQRSVEQEESKGGLVIKKAIYGKLQGDDLSEVECITVTRPLQALIKDSKLFIPEGTKLSELPGFYDPCYGEDKQISISYEFRHRLHQGQFSEQSKILIPSRDHLCDANTPLSPLSSPTHSAQPTAR